jgi:hypothetical protein
MIIKNGVVSIGNITGFSPIDKEVRFISDGTPFYISLKDLVRLYEGIKFDAERKGVDWKKYTDSLFENEK